MEKKVYRILLLSLVLLLYSQVALSFGSIEIDETAIVDRVIDGDTFDTDEGSRIRLADIDTPERGESGYYEARDFLITLVYNRRVYLDVDDVYGADRYGRLVCVVYVEHNSTHYKNVNEALLVYGYAKIWNFENEFDPYTWSLYYPKPPSQPQLFDIPSIVRSFLLPFSLSILLFGVILTMVILGIVLVIKMKSNTKLRREYRIVGLALLSLCTLSFGGLYAMAVIECTTRCLFTPYSTEYQIILAED